MVDPARLAWGLRAAAGSLGVEFHADRVWFLGFDDFAHQVDRVLRDMRGADQHELASIEFEDFDILGVPMCHTVIFHAGGLRFGDRARSGRAPSLA